MPKVLERRIGEVQEWLGTGTINFFGRQFAGKDTLANRLGKKWSVPVISGGDIMRNSDVPLHVTEAINRGELADTEEFVKIITPYLGQTAFVGNPLLLSAVGRMEGEEKAIVSATEQAGHPTMAVPLLDITEEEAFRRLEKTPSRGRADDTPEGLRNRLNAFTEMTLPVLTVYEEMGLLVRVDAMGTKELVFESLVAALHEKATSA